jgi:hypothetical protein
VLYVWWVKKMQWYWWSSITKKCDVLQTLLVTWLGHKMWPLLYKIRKCYSWVQYLLFKTYKSCRAGRPLKASPGTVCMALWQRRRSCSNDSPLNGFPSRLSIWLLARSLEPRIRLIQWTLNILVCAHSSYKIMQVF